MDNEPRPDPPATKPLRVPFVDDDREVQNLIAERAPKKAIQAARYEAWLRERRRRHG